MADKHIISLREKIQVAKDTMAFHFSKPEGFEFKAGQSADWTLINPPETDAEGNKRAFSIASAPYENELVFTTRMRNTAFKRVMKNLPIGSEIQFEGGFGSFTLHNDVSKPAVFLTGGIGITPVRSIIKQAVYDHLQHKMFLFYSNHLPEEAAFLHEFQEIAKQHINFTFIPTMTQVIDGMQWSGKKERISKEMLSENLVDLKASLYYICGPTGMVAALKQTLIAAGVNEDYIKTEDFTGY